MHGTHSQNPHILYEVLFESMCSYLNDILDHIYLRELQQQVIKLASDKKYSKKLFLFYSI